MLSPLSAFFVAAGLCVLQFAFAFVAAPHSAEWGLSAYVYTGIGLLILMLLIPFILQTQLAVLLRFCMALGFVALGSGAWLAGLFIANVRIFTRLI